MSELVQEFDFVRVLWDDEVQAVRMHWTGPAGGPEFREALERGLQTVVDRGAQRWLADLRGLGMINRQDQAFIDDDWLPRLVDSGVRYFARVSPESSKAQFSIREILQKERTKQLLGSQRLNTLAFDSLEEAREWLATCGEPA